MWKKEIMKRVYKKGKKHTYLLMKESQNFYFKKHCGLIKI